MRISKIFDLGASQGELDFVDIDIDTDLPLFLDPHFIASREDHWSIEASLTLKSFFQTFVDLLTSGKEAKARRLFDHLHEPNETCLGLSQGAPNGNAIGDVNANNLFESILESKAVVTRLVEDLEDVRFFIRGIDKDRVSDMTTNIIRGHLITYTQQQCDLWDIPMKASVPSGFMWDRPTRRWVNKYERMLIAEDRKILLVPKHGVSFVKKHTPEQYYRRFVLEYLQHEHLIMDSALVDHRKDGTPFVTKKSVSAKDPYSKEFLATFTENHPEIFDKFKVWAAKNTKAVSNKELADENPAVLAAYLRTRLSKIEPGHGDAHKYHKLMTGVLELIFYPYLTSPVKEKEVHDGRKRIDIIFDNPATSGFFSQASKAYSIPTPYVVVECKNYTAEVKNEEVDQLLGRFSDKRGRLGILACRTAKDLTTLHKRCNDVFVHGNGVILPLLDEDVLFMLKKLEDGFENPFDQRLRDIARSVIFQ